MKSCYKSEYLGALKGFMPDDLSHLGELLDRAVRQKETGGLTCTGCGARMVVPVLEWVEWREVYMLRIKTEMQGYYLRADGEMIVVEMAGPRLDPLTDIDEERAIPFIHRACSTRCGPGGKGNGWESPKRSKEWLGVVCN